MLLRRYGALPATVAWAAAELDVQPWTLLFDRGSSVGEAATKGWVVAGHAYGHPEPGLFASPCVGPIAFTRTTLDRVGGFDERYEGWAYEDVDFWYRLRRDVPRTAPQTYPGTPLVQFWREVGDGVEDAGRASVMAADGASLARVIEETRANARQRHRAVCVDSSVAGSTFIDGRCHSGQP